MSYRILITGAQGMLGQAVQDAIRARNDVLFYPADRSDADLENLDETQLLFQKVKPTHVLHLAARVGGLFMNMEENARMYDSNARIALNVLRCASQFKVKRVVSVLSTCALPHDTDKTVFTESDAMEGRVHPTNEGYGEAKRVLELLSRLYRDSSETEFLTVFPCNLYGPGDNMNPQTGHVLGALMARMHSAKEAGDDVMVVYGTGTPLRQWMLARDAAQLMLRVLLEFQPNINDPEEDRYRVFLAPGPEGELSISALAVAIAQTTGFKGRLDRLSTRPDGIHRKTASNARLLAHFPDAVFTPLEEGLRETYAWYTRVLEKNP